MTTTRLNMLAMPTWLQTVGRVPGRRSLDCRRSSSSNLLDADTHPWNKLLSLIAIFWTRDKMSFARGTHAARSR
jgi:hypothetical protein